MAGMDTNGKIRSIAWRGSSEPGTARTDRATPPRDQVHGRVLLLLGAGGNRELLARHLQETYEILEPSGETLPQEPFDLILVDIAGFRRWHQRVRDAKVREEPTFLPVVLVVSRQDLRQRLRTFWDAVDEFVVTPIDRHEFTERVSMLLRARSLALAQRSHLAYLVNHDRTTGLPNKNLFMDRLTNAIRDASVLNRPVRTIVVHVPLSRILKSLGHQGLERAAAICSSRLHALVGDDVSLARLTTEEWGLIQRPGDPLETVIELCAQIQRLGEGPFDVDGERIHLAPRIGVGIYPDDGSDATTTLDCAMSALSEARDSRPVFYSREVQHHALRFIRTESRLHEALERDQFELWFQPQLALADQRIVGVEALVRWRLPGGDLVPPGDFMAVAESTGLIREIDNWVLEKACATMQRWRNDGVEVGRVAVNKASADIKADDFADGVMEVLDRYQLPPQCLEIELTETTLFEIDQESLGKLGALRSHGLNIAIDDFGTGYSSLSYIHRLPITTLKIDKVFVDKVDHDETNAAITRTIVWLAKNFGLEIVAEGIETEKQAQYLASLDVGTGQGFLFARPMPESELRNWLERHESQRRRSTIVHR